MQVIGLCRFSYPAIGGFQVEHDTIEERIRFLYAEERLEERFQLMETVALPCLRAQTDPDFDLIIVIGDSLPAHHEARLRDLVAGMPQVRIEKHPPMPQRAVMKDILNKARRDQDKPCLQFRYDDDDAVSVDFIERLRATISDCPGLVARHRSVAVDFNPPMFSDSPFNSVHCWVIVRNQHFAQTLFRRDLFGQPVNVADNHRVASKR